MLDILGTRRMPTPTDRRCKMKGRLIAFVGIFCIAILIFSGTDAKGEKPDKPSGKPSGKEWIQFWGDLVGGQVVEGCCPNAGPNPSYDMCL